MRFMERPRNHMDTGIDLTTKILSFVLALRNQAIMVSHAAVLDALKCLSIIDIGNVRTFRSVLRCNFISCQAHIKPFNQLFDSFWLSWTKDQAQGYSDSKDRDGITPMEVPAQTGTNAESRKEASEQRVHYLCYSPHALNRKSALTETSAAESEALYRSMTKIINRLSHIKSRRYKDCFSSGRLNLRGMLRKNTRFGGEPMILDFKRKKPGRRRIVFFCDASGSMDLHTLMTFQFMHALKRAAPRTEIFFFSTDLTRATATFQEGLFFEAVQKLPQVVADWGGGTRIGHCFKVFNTVYGHRYLSRRPIVMIYSDGWDRGETHLLRSQIAWIKRRSYKLLWLNPLLGTRDYKPICRGMRAALPFTDYFLPAANLHDFRRTGKVIERIIHA